MTYLGGVEELIEAMTNPAAAMRMLITYAICIPVAIIIGYLLTNPLDYETLGFMAFVVAALLSPIFIKWHYPILVFGINCPILLFFMPTSPALWMAVVVLSLSISIIERTLSNEHRFFSVPAVTMPLMFLLGVILLTMELTGGIGFHQFGSAVGGGKKYVSCFLGIATFFAFISRGIPANHRKFYVFLFFCSTALDMLGDIGPHLPAPLSYINLLIPASVGARGEDVSLGSSRLGMISAGFNALVCWMLARHGLRGIFLSGKIWRLLAFGLCVFASQLGGFRDALVALVILFTLLFLFEKIYQTRLMPVFIMVGISGMILLVPFARHLPYVYQRSLAVLPLDLDPAVRVEAAGSSEWRLNMWRDLMPQIPNYLLLGKGFALTSGDFQLMGNAQGGSALGAASQLDASQGSLAISSDYHSGPLSTIIPFGIWGAIGMTWLIGAVLWVLYRNYRYSDPDLQTVNTFLLACMINQVILFLFVFGAFQADVGNFGKLAGFSVALNWGVRGPLARPANLTRFKPLPQPQVI